MKANPPQHYKTEKLSLAAYLITAGFSDLVNAECMDNSNVVVFALSPTPTPEQIASYFNGKGQVSALNYNNTLSNLKAAVFEAKNLVGGR